MSKRHVHYLRPAGSTQLPRHHLVLDVETKGQLRNGTYEQSWRLACVQRFNGHLQRGWKMRERKTYRVPMELWVDVNGWVRPDERLVIWCHNLAYDLRVSAGLAYLPALGFELEAIALDHVASWARFTRDGETILLVDLCSWLPAPLSKIAEDLGMRQVPRPRDTDSDDAFMRRCERDVEITTAAVLECLSLVEDHDLGPWRPTGSGQSHSAWRRRWMTHRLLVHDDLKLLSMERAGSWTGRCEAWRHGTYTDGPYYEYDLDLAYCQIAADSEIPCVLAGPASTTDLPRLAEAFKTHAVLARVTVETEYPLVPTLLDDRILWPVGRFDTTLWDPELSMLIDAGANVAVHEAWLYRKAPGLRAVAEWIIGHLQLGPGELSPVQLRVLKHWARALVGRCAMRYRSWELWGWDDADDVQMGLMEEWETHQIFETMQVGQQIRRLGEQVESPESLPQVPGWIMAECRRRLWTLVQAAGTDTVYYMDTDSIIVDQLGASGIERERKAGRLPPLHTKGRYQSLDILGPRMLTVDETRRMAGIPLQARLDENGVLAGEVFTSLQQSLMRHQISTVEVLTRTYTAESADRRRDHLDDGHTRPISISTAS